MQYESAKALKQELLHEIVIPISQAAHSRWASSSKSTNISEQALKLIETTNFSVPAGSSALIPKVQRSIALGIAPYGKEFRLAVRVQRQDLLKSPMIEHIIQQARGEADVRFIGRVDKRILRASTDAIPWYQANARPLLIGTSIGHFNITAGTIGAFVKRSGRSYILSNNHVLANEDQASDGDPILQCGKLDGGKDPHDRVAALRHWVRLKKNGANFIDAALAEIDEGISCEPALLQAIVNGANRQVQGIGPAFLDEKEVVYKVGRTTGATRGRVTAFDFDELVVNYDAGNLRFDGQIEIEGIGKRAFSAGGDSGSLIVNSDMQAVALLFAGSDTGGSNGLGLTYANPIHTVLKELKADLLL